MGVGGSHPQRARLGHLQSSSRLPGAVSEGVGRELMPGKVGTPALSISSLSKTFAGTRALDDVSVTLRHGELHALVGANGSGKSTLIKVVAGVARGDGGGVIRA